MKNEILKSGASCTKCGGKLWPNAKFCHHCGGAVFSERPIKRVSSHRAGRANAHRKIIAGILVATAVILGIYLIHSGLQTQSLHFSPTQSNWPTPPSQDGGHGGSAILYEGTTPASTTYQLRVDGTITNVQAPSGVDEGQTTTISVTIKNTGNIGTTFRTQVSNSGGSQSEEVFLGVDGSQMLTFNIDARRSGGDITVSLFHDHELLDMKTESVAILYPELTLAQTMSGWDWTRGEDDLPRAVVEVRYAIKNEGAGLARDVNLTLKNGEETRSWNISYISPGQEHRDGFTISTSPVWRNIDGSSFLTEFEAQAELVTECGGHEVKDYLSVSIPRGLIESDERYAPYLSPYLVTPNDPIVKSTLENILAEKDWWDLRTVEAYLHDWVGGGITGLGITGGVRYDFEKIDVDEWFEKHEFWSHFPRETIQYGRGVCIDQAILYATFLRAYGYGPDDVYVICGIPLRGVQEALHETLGLEVAGHAWVVYKKEILGYEHWVLVETTQGGISRVVTPIERLWDYVARALGQEELQFYEGYYAFNDVRFREIKSMNTSQDSVSSGTDGLATDLTNSEDESNLRSRVQATVNSLRVSDLSREQMEQYKEHLLDYYVDYSTFLFENPLRGGCENPVNLLIFVKTETKEDSKQAILSMFEQLGYFDSNYRLEFASTMYPTDREIELYREFSVAERDSLLQFHMRGMYVRETELGHLWAVCGHLEYSATNPIDHLFNQITREMADANDCIVWPYVKWESFEEDIRLQLLNESSVSYEVSYVAGIDYGNSSYYEENDEYHFNDGTLPVIVAEGVT